MSTMVVTPPAAAARVAVGKPSHSVRPGSLTCTWVSTRPGSRATSPRSSTGPVADVGGRRPATAAIRPSKTQTAAGRSPSGSTDPPRPHDQVGAHQILQGGPVEPDLARVQGAAVQPAQQEPGQRPGGGRLVEDARRRSAAGPGSAAAGTRPPAPPPGRTRRSPRTASAAGPGAGPSPGRSRVPGSAGPAGRAAPRPRARPRSAPTGSTLVEPSDSRTPVPAAATCITALAWSAAGWSMDWYCGGDPDGGRVVVGAVVQADAPAGRGVDHPGDGGRAVGAEHGRGVSICSSNRSEPAASPCAGSSRSQRTTIASTCSTALTFGSVMTKPGRRRAQRREEQVERAHGPAPGRRLQALAPQPDERGARPRRGRPSPRPPAAASSSSSARRRSRPRSRSAGPRSARARSLASTRSVMASANGSGPCALDRGQRHLPYAAGSPAS